MQLQRVCRNLAHPLQCIHWKADQYGHRDLLLGRAGLVGQAPREDSNRRIRIFASCSFIVSSPSLAVSRATASWLCRSASSASRFGREPHCSQLHCSQLSRNTVETAIRYAPKQLMQLPQNSTIAATGSSWNLCFVRNGKLLPVSSRFPRDKRENWQLPGDVEGSSWFIYSDVN